MTLALLGDRRPGARQRHPLHGRVSSDGALPGPYPRVPPVSAPARDQGAIRRTRAPASRTPTERASYLLRRVAGAGASSSSVVADTSTESETRWRYVLASIVDVGMTELVGHPSERHVVLDGIAADGVAQLMEHGVDLGAATERLPSLPDVRGVEEGADRAGEHEAGVDASASTPGARPSVAWHAPAERPRARGPSSRCGRRPSSWAGPARSRRPPCGVSARRIEIGARREVDLGPGQAQQLAPPRPGGEGQDPQRLEPVALGGVHEAGDLGEGQRPALDRRLGVGGQAGQAATLRLTCPLRCASARTWESVVRTSRMLLRA